MLAGALETKVRPAVVISSSTYLVERPDVLLAIEVPTTDEEHLTVLGEHSKMVVELHLVMDIERIQPKHALDVLLGR